MGAARPTTAGVAAMRLAQPAVFAWIRTNICESGPPLAAPQPGVVSGPGGVTGVPLLPPGGPGPDSLTPPSGPPLGPPSPYTEGPVVDRLWPPFGPPLAPRGPEGPIRPPAPPDTSTPAVVPEPGTWALMLVGFGCVGSALRQKARTRRAR